MHYAFKKNYMILGLFLSALFPLQAQNNVIDEIIARVGHEIVLKSDIENRYKSLMDQGYSMGSSDLKTEILEDLMIQKLMIAQAEIDSVEVTEQEVDDDLDRRLEMFIQKFGGSQEKMEQYFGKTIQEMKNDLRDDTRNERIKEKMQAEITKNIYVTPAEVRKFYENFNKDSLPIIPGEIEIQQIVRYPRISEDEKDRVRNRLREFRERVLNGESFSSLALRYSQDPGTYLKGGELGYMPRAELVPEFANVAFNLKGDNISKIVETEYGFHIIQLIDRRGDLINVRHILLKPKVEEEERNKAISQLDSIGNLIRNNKIEFDNAAFYFSEDKDTRNNGGLIVNPYTGSSKFEKDNLPPAIARQVNQLKINEVSEPFLDQSEEKETYRMIKIKSETKAHKANIEDDWSIFENMLTNQKQQNMLTKWVKEKLTKTSTYVDPSYQNSKFRFSGWIK